MKLKKTIGYLSLIPLTLLSGCATIMNGTNQSIGISTNPSGAEVWLDDMLAGHSPIVLEMKRNNNHFIRIQLEGYQPYELAVTREISGWVAGNIVFGGFIGLAVDALTGGIYNLTPEQVRAEMHKGNIAFSKKSGETFVAIVMEADPAWERIDNMIVCK